VIHYDDTAAVDATHPEGRQAVFVGDLVDRGPDTPAVLRLVMGMVASGNALCVSGNPEAKLVRALRGAKVTVSHGLAESLEQMAAESDDFNKQALVFMDGLISHYVLDDGLLVVAHAGLKEPATDDPPAVFARLRCTARQGPASRVRIRAGGVGDLWCAHAPGLPHP